MPEPYELLVAYDGFDADYLRMIFSSSNPRWVGTNRNNEKSRFTLINEALDRCKGKYIMHLENDFYWENPYCIDSAFYGLEYFDDIDYIRFENLPFTEKQFEEYRELPLDILAVMRKDAPYQFTFNPHLRREKFPCGRFMERGFTKQPEQHHNDNYKGTSGCLLEDNFRHLGIYDEGGHFKPWYAERFTLVSGDKEIKNPLHTFMKFCDDPEYIDLFMRYLNDHRN